MNLFRETERIKAQIVDTQRLLELVLEHPLMSVSLKERLYSLQAELEELPKESNEPKISLLFSGKAVVGSLGIKSSFVSKTIKPLQEMIKTQVAYHRFSRSGKRGHAKRGDEPANTELYLTALPTGSFGMELSQLESNDLFDSEDVSNAMKQVMTLIYNTSVDEETFEKTIEDTPKKNLVNLKQFLHEVSEENSVLKMVSGELGIELTNEKVSEAYNRVAATDDEEEEIFIEGVFRGLLLDSGRFEIQDVNGKKISGFISDELSEEELINIDKYFLNENCVIHLKLHRTKFITGREKVDFELIEITPKKSTPTSEEIL